MIASPPSQFYPAIFRENAELTFLKQNPRRIAPAGLLVLRPSPLKGERIRRLASLLASRSWRGVVAAARTPLQAALTPLRGASFAILSPFRGEG